MRIRFIAAMAFILLMVAFLNAQPPGKKPGATTAASNQASSDFEYEVSIDQLGLAGITVRRKTGLGLFTPGMLASFANQSAKSSLNLSYVIRPDKDSKMADILAAVESLRGSPKTDMRIEVDSGLAIFIPKKVDPNATPKPNPLFLLVNVDEKSSILLNNESEGSFPDTSKIEQHLKQIFKDRAANGVWRQGTTTTDTTVLIKLAKNMTFTDLVNLARAVKRAGSDNVGLQVDESDIVLTVDITKP